MVSGGRTTALRTQQAVVYRSSSLELLWLQWSRLPCSLKSRQAATADLLESARAQGHEFEILAKPVHPADLLAKLKG